MHVNIISVSFLCHLKLILTVLGNIYLYMLLCMYVVVLLPDTNYHILCYYQLALGNNANTNNGDVHLSFSVILCHLCFSFTSHLPPNTLTHTQTLLSDFVFKNSVLFSFCLQFGLIAAQCIDLSHFLHFIKKV